MNKENKVKFEDLNIEEIDAMAWEIGEMFCSYACFFQINLNQEDLNYIKRVIKKDKCYPYIEQAYRITKQNIGEKRISAAINLIVFYDEYYDAVQCPPNIKNILFAVLGWYRSLVDEKYPGLLMKRYVWVKNWQERVRGL